MMAKIFNTSSAQLPFVLADDIVAWRKSPMEAVTVKKGPANEVIEADPDLYKLPVPHHSEGDGGSYLTSSVVIAKDPDTGVRNLSVHRMMVVGKNRFTMLLEELGHLMDYYKRAEAKGEALELNREQWRRLSRSYGWCCAGVRRPHGNGRAGYCQSTAWRASGIA